MGKKTEEPVFAFTVTPTEETAEALATAGVSMEDIDLSSVIGEPVEPVVFDGEVALVEAMEEKPMNFTTNTLAIEKHEAENAWKEELMRQNNEEAAASKAEYRHPYGK